MNTSAPLFQILILILIQSDAFGQLSQWTKEVAAKNKLKVVSVYIKVPKTNPAYYEEPRGLMPISETKFGRDGLVTEDVCKDCAVCFDCDKEPSDVRKEFHFANNRLLQIDIKAWAKSTALFYYDSLKQRRLTIIVDNNNKRNEVRIEFLDEDNRETNAFGIDFESTWIERDSVRQIFLSRSTSTYTKSTKVKKEFGYGGGTRIDRRRFEVFTSSLDFDEISKTFESLDYSHLDLWKYRTTYYDSNDNELRIVDEEDGKPVREYKRDKRGLIETELIHYPLYTFKHLYRYQYWD